MADPDWEDPCAVLAWIRPQYYRVISGGAEIRIVYKGVDTTYGQADVSRLEAAIKQLEADCARKSSGSSGRRRAIRFG